jgi:hypothetical protein
VFSSSGISGRASVREQDFSGVRSLTPDLSAHIRKQEALVETFPEPVTAGRSWLRINKRKRILLGIVALAVGLLALIFDKWMLGAGRGMYWLMAPFIVYILLLVFRPQWVVRFEKSEEDRLKNWKPHPGQFMR